MERKPLNLVVGEVVHQSEASIVADVGPYKPQLTGILPPATDVLHFCRTETLASPSLDRLQYIERLCINQKIDQCVVLYVVEERLRHHAFYTYGWVFDTITMLLLLGVPTKKCSQP